jgi:hypothetical protein
MCPGNVPLSIRSEVERGALAQSVHKVTRSIIRVTRRQLRFSYACTLCLDVNNIQFSTKSYISYRKSRFFKVIE